METRNFTSIAVGSPFVLWLYHLSLTLVPLRTIIAICIDTSFSGTITCSSVSAIVAVLALFISHETLSPPQQDANVFEGVPDAKEFTRNGSSRRAPRDMRDATWHAFGTMPLTFTCLGSQANIAGDFDGEVFGRNSDWWYREQRVWFVILEEPLSRSVNPALAPAR